MKEATDNAIGQNRAKHDIKLINSGINGVKIKETDVDLTFLGHCALSTGHCVSGL